MKGGTRMRFQIFLTLSSNKISWWNKTWHIKDKLNVGIGSPEPTDLSFLWLPFLSLFPCPHCQHLDPWVDSQGKIWKQLGQVDSKYANSKNNILISCNNLWGKDKRHKVNSKNPTVLVMLQLINLKEAWLVFIILPPGICVGVCASGLRSRPSGHGGGGG